MRPIPTRAYVFIAITCLVAVPFVNDLVRRKSFIRIVRNSAAQAISAGVAAMSFQLVIMSMADQLIGRVGEVIVAGAVAATMLVVLDLGQIIALQLVLGTERLTRSTMGWIGRTGRAQLLWGLAAVITIEIVLIPPWFLLPASTA